jgi:integrase
VPLTEAKCKAARAANLQAVIVDRDGLELWVYPSKVGKPPSMTWRFRYRLRGETQRRERIGRWPEMSLADARQEANRMRGAVLAGNDPAPKRKRPERPEPREPAPEPEHAPTLDDVIDRYITERKAEWSANTRRANASAIAAFRAWAASAKITTVSDVTTASLASFRVHAIARPSRRKAKGGSRADVVETDQRRSPAAVNFELAVIKSMMEALRRTGVLTLSSDDIADNLRLLALEHARPDPLRPAQIRDLLTAVARHDDNHPAIRPLVIFMLLTGMRLGEAKRVTWADVDMHEQTIRVVAGKTKRERTVDMTVSPALARMLTAMRGAGKSGRIFPGPTAKARLRLISDYGAPAFQWSTRNSRPGERSVPTLRSTCGTYLANAPGIFGGASARRTADQLGHSVDVAERHYLGAMRRIPADAKTLEDAMEIADLLQNE